MVTTGNPFLCWVYFIGQRIDQDLMGSGIFIPENIVVYKVSNET